LPASASTLCDLATRNSERLLKLINELLDLRKLESEESDVRLQTHLFEPVILESIELNRAYAEKFNVTIEIDFEKQFKSVLVNFDQCRIIQVMSNLISNAAKYSPSGGVIRVRSVIKDEKIRICVIDEGDGIPENFQAEVFDKFTQADSSTTRAKGGTGLGLSICKHIIDSHMGKIDFTSSCEQGTTFYFDLPIGKDEVKVA